MLPANLAPLKVDPAAGTPTWSGWVRLGRRAMAGCILESMRVPDVIPDCVVFLCVKEEDGRVSYRGTAFQVAVRSEAAPEDRGWSYLVTARHNVFDSLDQYRQLYARLNAISGDAQLVELPRKWWMCPDDDASDVAVLRFPPSEDESTLAPIPNTMFATKDVVQAQKIGIGEDVIVTGLFSEVAGRHRNLPVVRAGIIAAMPEEPLQDLRSGLDYRAYMVELRSFGGLSGSPVFVRLDPNRAYGVGGNMTRYYLLGLIRGHWDSYGPVKFPDNEIETMNLGMGIVTPIDEVCRVLFQSSEVHWRRQRERVYRVDMSGGRWTPEPP